MKTFHKNITVDKRIIGFPFQLWKEIKKKEPVRKRERNTCDKVLSFSPSFVCAIFPHFFPLSNSHCCVNHFQCPFQSRRYYSLSDFENVCELFRPRIGTGAQTLSKSPFSCSIASPGGGYFLILPSTTKDDDEFFKYSRCLFSRILFFFSS